MVTEYPSDGKICMNIEGTTEKEILLKLRIPSWCRNATIDGKNCVVKNGYCELKVKTGQELLVDLPMEIEAIKQNGKTAFMRGPIVLARDEEKENQKIDIEQEETIVGFKTLPVQKDEYFRCEATTENGHKIILSDYKSCGKNWTGQFNKVSVWLNIK